MIRSTHDGAPAGADRRKRLRRLAATAGAAAAVALVATACGSSSGSSSTTGSDSATSKAAATDPGVAAAKAAIAPYTGHPSAFPVDKPLSKPIPPGTTIAYLQPGTPTGAQGGDALAVAAKALGAKLVRVNAGTTASQAQAAAASALAMKPDAVVVGGIQLSFFGDGLKRLSDAGVKVVSDAVAQDTKPFGVTFNYDGPDQFAHVGRLMADWVIVNKGPEANVVFYAIPALDFSGVVQKAFVDELHKNCPGCSVRTEDINIATLGNTSARTVVSDLQSHPDTDVAVFLAAEIAAGLPSAMRAAGVSGITTMGYAPSPQQLGYIKAGQMTGALGLDISVFNWTVVDIVARLILGDELTPDEIAGSYPMQFLTKDSVTPDALKNGWTGYPDYAERFNKLWHPGA